MKAMSHHVEDRDLIQDIEDAICEYWGERCDDFEPSCIVCAIWKRFDDLVDAERDLGRRAV